MIRMIHGTCVIRVRMGFVDRKAGRVGGQAERKGKGEGRKGEGEVYVKGGKGKGKKMGGGKKDEKGASWGGFAARHVVSHSTVTRMATMTIVVIDGCRSRAREITKRSRLGRWWP